MNAVSDRMVGIERLVEALEKVDAPARTAARELVSAVLELHRAGLTTMLQQMRDGTEARDACLADPLVTSLLILHDLHPVPRELRIERALDEVRAGLGPEGSLDVLAIDDRRVHIRVHSSVASAGWFQEAKKSIETAIWRAAPDVGEVLVTGGNGRVQLPIVSEGAP
jgi:hypothetical protein